MSSKKGVKHKKTPREWTNIYEDLKVTKIKITKDNNQSVEKEVLLCKYCGIEFDYQNSHISTRNWVHLVECHLVEWTLGRKGHLVEWTLGRKGHLVERT
jgi:hypothetical protein